MTRKQILDAWAKIRGENNTIPDDVLDFMKDAAIEKLPQEPERIEVLAVRSIHQFGLLLDCDTHLVARTSLIRTDKPIPEELFPSIKEAIEKAINHE